MQDSLFYAQNADDLDPFSFTDCVGESLTATITICSPWKYFVFICVVKMQDLQTSTQTDVTLSRICF